MKICLIGLTYPFRGGISHYTFMLARELRKAHRVDVISFKALEAAWLPVARTQRDPSARVFNLEHAPLISNLDPRSWLQALAAINRQKPDLVVLQYWNGLCLPAYIFFCMAIRWLLRLKVCYLCHKVLPQERRSLFTSLTLLGLMFAGRFIVHSHSDAAILRRVFPWSLVRRAPHPVYDQFRLTPGLTRAEAKRTLGITGPALLFFGHIRPSKGLEYVIEALPHVLAQMNCTLLIAGDFNAGEKTYRERIERYGLSEKVRIINRYIPNEEIEIYFLAADVIVLPYVTASHSGVLEIARSFNLPAVATQVGGVPEQICHGKTGLLVPPRDSDALAEAIVTFFQENNAEQFRKNIELARGCCNWDRVAEAIISLA